MYQKIASIYEPFGWGEFSEKLFRKLRPLLRKWQIKTHLDLACGSGIFVARFTELGITSHGIDLSAEMIKVAKKHYPQLRFLQADMTKYRAAEAADLVTCNYDSINHLHKFSDWQKVFRGAHDSLNEQGRFLFDINTVQAVNNTNFTNYYSHHDNVMINKVYSQAGKLIFDLEWFVKNNQGLYERQTTIVEESSFPYPQIKTALKEVGFKKISIINSTINSKSNNTPERKDRLYILAEK
jgi:SAM-dependent methyltransferase